MEKLAKGKMSPVEMFKTEESLKQYSKWDDQGIPTHDINGEELPKSRRKKLVKEYEGQVKAHGEYKAYLSSGGSPL
jgi:cysteinyl-tRNA synthetase